MLNKTIWIALVSTVFFAQRVQSQPAVAPLTAEDRARLCHEYGDAPVVFVGRASAPIAVHVSGEAEIEQARQNAQKLEAELKELQAQPDPAARLEREIELTMRAARARAEFEHRRAMYPPPHDVRLIPLTVERAFRGVTEPVVMFATGETVKLRSETEPVELIPDDLYLIAGRRSHNMIPPFPEIWNRPDITEYIVGRVPQPIASAVKDLQFLATALHGSLFGTLSARSFGEVRGGPLRNTRILVTTSAGSTATTTNDKGEFSISAIPGGRVEINPVLPENLGIVNRRDLSFEMNESGCRAVQLTAAVNGRVRGRIISSTGSSLERVQLTLGGYAEISEPQILRSDDDRPTTTIRPNQDGSYEFWAQSPGKYLLSASVERREPNGRVRRVVTFYPGTDDRNAAIPITIGVATLQDGIDFVVVSE